MKLIKSTLRTCILLLAVSFLSSPGLLMSENNNLVIHSETMTLDVEQMANGFGVPWAMAFLSADKLLITEREGFVYLLNLKTRQRQKLKNVADVLTGGQGGMLDLALSPDFEKSGWVYFTYVKPVNSLGVTVLARARLTEDRFSQWQELMVSNSATDTSRHFGSRIAFDRQGHVFFSIGDRGERANAQNLANHAGSILRLNLDGSVPEDNPFFTEKAILPEIWSYGHRNPQGLVYDEQYHRLWSIEHGPRGGDEINLIMPGQNYGWPVISYGKEYWGPVAVGEGTHRKGMQQPVQVYIPSIAPGSLMLYSHDALAKWKGNLFSGALKLRHINRIVLNKEAQVVKEERLLEKLNKRIRALAQSPEGWLYFSTDNGEIYRIKPRD
ncbi:MAG: PQQ-dependent sugar dehydrogenase [Gammaproteobacteria bacterium]|nr:PQQ-dependent sugar dehydrogenase [Gammaproteobacteria bacterium]